MGAVLAVMLVSAAVGAVVARWPTVAVALIVWPLFALGIWQGWWGHGFSKDDEDSVLVAFYAIYSLLTAVSAALGVAVGRAARSLRAERAAATH